VPKAPPPSLSKEQIGTIVAQADPSTEQGARDVALFQFLSETGARASEASAVTLGDIDLLAQSGSIRSSYPGPAMSTKRPR